MSGPGELLVVLTEFIVPVIDLIALGFILVGTVVALWEACRVMLGQLGGHAARAVWLNYSRWLVAGLTFQLAADIAETSIAPGWDDLGRLAAIAIIRTFLNYFLERDQREMRETQLERIKPEHSARLESKEV